MTLFSVTLWPLTTPNHPIFTSTLQNQPHKAGLKCPFVCPQEVTSISMKFGMQVEVDDGMQYDPIQG